MNSKKLSSICSTLCCVVLMMFAATSCDGIYDDLEPCPQGVSLRFVYDYNMEYANAFPKKVDCVTLYIYDGTGNYIGTRTETTAVLQDENYRMTIDLEPGDYSFVAYGGLACDKASFHVLSEPSRSLQTDLQVEMNHDGLTSDAKLHDFFFGTHRMTVEETDMDYREETLYMMKNTNNIRIVLQQLNGEPVNKDDFSFYLTDDNTLFAHDNSLIPNGEITYFPWAEGQGVAGQWAETDEEVVVAYAEFSTSRLVTDSRARLVIKRNDLGTDIVNIPLIDYLLLLKSQQYADMPSQEFLDRESEWSFVFFLDTKHAWINTQIIINDWIVRFNDFGV